MKKYFSSFLRNRASIRSHAILCWQGGSRAEIQKDKPAPTISLAWKILFLSSLFINIFMINYFLPANFINSSAETLSRDINNFGKKDEREKSFDFKKLLGQSSMIFRTNDSPPKILVMSPNNTPQYILDKTYIKELNIDSVKIGQCTMNFTHGDIIQFNGKKFYTDCEDFTIVEDEKNITIDSNYETPINSSQFSATTEGNKYSIPIYNTVCYDKDHELDLSLWSISTKYNYLGNDRIYFYTPIQRKVNLLALEKNISPNFTVYLGIEPSKGNTYAEPFILINDEVSIDFGFRNGKSILIRYVKQENNVEIPVKYERPFDRNLFSKYYNLEITKKDKDLLILLKDSDARDANAYVVLNEKDIFLPKIWSKFAIGNTQKSRGFELQSILIVGKEDEQK